MPITSFLKCCFVTISLALAFAQNATAKEVNILFIGNSYVSTNHLPSMIANIAKSDQRNNDNFNIEQFTLGGATLTTLWEDGRALQKIQSKVWDHVIFQEQSTWAMYPNNIQNAFQVAPKWQQAIAPFATNVGLFVTWARQPYSSWYEKKDTVFFQSATYMQQQLNTHSETLASLLGATTIPVGDYWGLISSRRPEVNLYQADGSHPSIAGTYVTALIFYQYFSGRHHLTSLSYRPNGVSVSNVRMLRNLVSQYHF